MAALAESTGLEQLSLAGLPGPLTLRLPVPLSDDELIAFSHRNRPYRIERNANGELEVMSPVGFEGGQRELFVIRVLANWAEDHGGVCVSSNAGFTLPDKSVRSPDASWISEARVAKLTPAEKRGFAPICPDFLIEILSESDQRVTLAAKMEMWIGNGAQLAWMIDPYAREIWIYRSGSPAQLLHAPDFVEADTVVPGFKLDTARLWDR